MPFPLSRRVVSAALCTCVLSTIMGCNNAPNAIKIGVAQPLTGNFAHLGQDMLNGVKLAAEEINKQGGLKINNGSVMVEVVALDDRGSTTTGKEVAQRLVDAGVAAVVGHLNSGVSIDAAPIYAAKGIPQLAISTNVRFTQLGLPTTFRLVANDAMQSKAIGSYASTHFNGKKYAVLDDGTAYGKGLADGALKEITAQNKEVVLRQTFDDKTTAFNPIAEKIKAAQVEVIVAMLNDFQVLALIEALQKINYTEPVLMGGDIIKTADMLKGAGLMKGGIYATSPILEVREFMSGNKFSDAYRTAFGMAPVYGAHYSYDAMQVLFGVIRSAQSIDPKVLTQKLHMVDVHAPITGSMRFDDKGEQRYGSIAVYSARRDRWEPRIRSSSW